MTIFSAEFLIFYFLVSNFISFVILQIWSLRVY